MTEIIFNDMHRGYFYRDESGNTQEAVRKGNKLYTQEGIELCAIHARGTKSPENRKQRRSKKRS